MLDVRRLQFLVELSRRGTIAGVSEALHMSASGISHQLSVLEREAGTPLLERVGRGVRLTDAGRRLAERGADILAALESAHTDVRSAAAEPSGICRVAAFGSAARTLLPALLDFQRSRPGLRVELVDSEPEVALVGLLSGDLDLVVSEEYPGQDVALPRHVQRDVLANDPLEIVVAPSLLEGRGVPDSLVPADLGQCPWALEPVGAASRTWAVHHCSGLGFTPTVQYESWDLGLLLLLVQHGAAASILPRLALPPGRETPGLIRRETGWARTLVLLARRARANDPSVSVVRSVLHAELKGRAL